MAKARDVGALPLLKNLCPWLWPRVRSFSDPPEFQKPARKRSHFEPNAYEAPLVSGCRGALAFRIQKPWG